MNLDLLKNVSIKNGILALPREVMMWFKMLEAGWVHNGDPKKPHAILRGDMHSTGFFLCKKVLAYGNLREMVAACMIERLKAAGLGKIDGVFGSPYSSILLAGDVGRLLGVKTYVPEKGPKDADDKDTMVFKPDDPIPEGAVILQIEELVTAWTSGSLTAKAMVAGNPFPFAFAPLVGVFVHRPPRLDGALLPDGRKIVAFIERQVDAWMPADCPLCKKGSVVLRPKTQWPELTA